MDARTIETARRQLGMSDGDYRAVLWVIGRARSAADLTAPARRQLVAYFAACGLPQTSSRLTNIHENHLTAQIAAERLASRFTPTRGDAS